MKTRTWMGLLAGVLTAGFFCFFWPGHALAQDTPKGLVISEACADNSFVWTLDFQDYVELFNAGDTAVNLKDYRIQIKKKTAALPDLTVAPGEYCVVICDGELIPSLPKGGCTLSILDAEGAAADSVTLPAGQRQVWLRETGLSYMPSPGFPNTDEGAAAWHRSVCGELTFSEALSANFLTVRSSREKEMDVLEIYNGSGQPVSLWGYYLSDSRKDLLKFRMPAVMLKPGEYYTFYCTDRVNENHTGFKLSAGGEVVYLSRDDGTVADALNIPPLTMDRSYGRTDHMTGYFVSPTPGKANSALYGRMAPQPELSVPSSGGHTEAFTVLVTGEGPFYYTTDGSAPTASSTLYRDGILITDTTVLRVIACPQNAAPSQPVTGLYRFDTHKYTLPTVTVSVNPDYLNNSAYGLLQNPEDKDLEVPAVITFLNPDGSLKFSQDCGLAIAGQTSRRKKHRGWKVTFKSKFGKENLDCQVFDDWEVSSFDSLLLRVGTNGNPINDVFGAALGRDICPEVIYQHYRPVQLFINQRYYGIYYLREHINANFIVNHLGGDESQVDMIYDVSEVKLGSGEDWQELVKYCRTHSLHDQANFDYVASQIDVDSFMDYFIWRPYTGDSDHPNIRYVRSRAGDDPRWHIVIYDMDWAFKKPESGIGMNKYTYKRYEEERHNNVVIYALLENPGFRQAFLERFAYHMRVTFDTNRVLGTLEEIRQELEHDMPYMQKDWGESLTEWQREFTSIRKFVLSGGDRRSMLLRETQAFFSLSDDEMRAFFGNIPY